jgi:hypothetical protein
MGNPKEMFGTNLPSMTSRWRKSTPAASAFEISSPRWSKSAVKIDGPIQIDCIYLPTFVAALVDFVTRRS